MAIFYLYVYDKELEDVIKNRRKGGAGAENDRPANLAL
jgi:hypothetical protein